MCWMREADMNVFIQQNGNSLLEQGSLTARQCRVDVASVQLQGEGLQQQGRDSWPGRVGITYSRHHTKI